MSTTEPQELAGLVAVVTGSSAGIGKAIALELAAAGAACIIHGRNRQAAEQVVSHIQEAGGTARAILCDVSDASAHAVLVEQAWQWQGHVDVWVNNAGADVLTGQPAAGLRAKAGRAVASRRPRHDGPIAVDRRPHEGPRRRRDRQHRLGPGRARHGRRQRRAVRRDERRRHGVHPQPGPVARPASARQLRRARLDQNRLGRGGLRAIGKQRARRESLLDRWGTPKTWPARCGSWRRPRPPSSPAKSFRSTAA